MSSLERDNQISHQVSPIGRTVILTCGSYSLIDLLYPFAYGVAPADPRDGSWGSYSLRGN